jgi:hypothetical protein
LSALYFGLFSHAFDVPGPEALVVLIVACKVAILEETHLLMSTEGRADYFVVTHGERSRQSTSSC